MGGQRIPAAPCRLVEHIVALLVEGAAPLQMAVPLQVKDIVALRVAGAARLRCADGSAAPLGSAAQHSIL